MQIKGGSGAILIIRKDVITKDHPCLKHQKRLKQQKKKQQFFLKNYNIENISAPKVLPNKDIFTMEMLKSSLNIFDYIKKSNIEEINNFIDLILSFLRLTIQDSKYKNIKFEVVKNKYESIDKKEFKHRLDKLFKKFRYKYILLPCGFCHGDLSLTNILMLDNKVYLIDFLNTFIDSPIQDMVKLRQDTKYNWGMHINNINDKKLKNILKYIDKKICKEFTKFNFYKKYYKLFQFLNLVRILPYTKEFDDRKFLFKCIENLF